MIPVRTERSNFVYRGPRSDIGDAWVQRAPQERAVYLEWKLEEQDIEQLKTILASGTYPLLRLGIYGMEPIPPVSLGISGSNLDIVDDREPPKGDLRSVFEKPELKDLSVRGEEVGGTWRS